MGRSMMLGVATVVALLGTPPPLPAEWMQIGKLLASDGAAIDQFGWSVAISGEALVVGAPDDEGAAYVFERDAATGEWLEAAKLLASDGAAGDSFGKSVAISGETLVVGAPLEDELGSAAGSAYVFERDGATGAWLEVAKLLASDGEAGDRFGDAVAMSGETIVVGASHHDDLANESGAAYVFERDGATGAWLAVAKLLASDGAHADVFGRSVAVSGETIVVGATGDDDMGSESGSAYVFERDRATGEWLEVAKLLASDGADFDIFGTSVAMSGEARVGPRWPATVEVVVGAPHDFGGDPGSYVFERDAATGAWLEVANLLSSDGVDGDRFGYSVALSSEALVVGALWDDDLGSNSGSAYVFAPVDLGGSVTGMRARRGLCRNVSTGQEVEIDLLRRPGPEAPLAGVGFWDCREAGLATAPGDEVLQRVVGRTRAVAPISGTVAGIDAEGAGCLNETTGQLVSIDLEVESATFWNCSDAGLEAAEGDRIDQMVKGTAK